MHPVLFHIGAVTIFSFGLFLALAIVVGGSVIALLARRYRLPTKGLFDNLLFIIFAGVVGSRIAYVVAYSHYFRYPEGSWTNVFALWQGGLVYYGALILGVLAAAYVFRQEGKAFWRWMDFAVLGLLIGIAFGQTGCLLGQCAEGVVSTSKWSINGHIPVQMYEAIWSALLFIIGLVVYGRNIKWRRGGLIFFFGGLGLVGGRLILDIWRPSLLSWNRISLGVWLDICLLLLMLLVMLIMLARRRRMGPEEMV